jgi:trk system potassium uptake protein TrkH
MNRRLVLKIIGRGLLVEALCMTPSICIALIGGEGDAWCLIAACALTALAGLLLARVRAANAVLHAREGLASVALCWGMLSVFGSLPFSLGGYMSVVDGLFECVSGFTTTGATILKDIEALPKGLLFWRSFTNWIGGMGILVLSTALMPKVGARAVHLLRAESTGPNPGKLVPKLGAATRILYLIYIGLSALTAVALMILGMRPFDALTHMFSIAGTGGFSIYNASIGHYNSAAVDAVVSTFVLLFGVNFSLYFFLFNRHFKEVLKNEELRAYLIVIAAAVLVVAVSVFPAYKNVGQALRYSYFQVTAMITTTGFATADFTLWPTLAKSVLVILMLLGACAGSTSGGIKIVRAMILAKGASREVGRTIRPRNVSAVKLQGHVVEDEMISQVMAFFFAYVLLIFLGTLAVSADNLDFETSFTAALSAISNIGPGLGAIGPTGNFGIFSPFSKIALSLLMLTGRLEIFPVLMLLNISRAWKRK